MSAASIPSKARFYGLWHAGLLGNRPRTWANADALRASGFQGAVTIRSTGPSAGAVRYRVPAAEAAAVAWPGATFNESMPDESLLLQGEVQRSESGLDLTYSLQAGLTMRQAMRSARFARGLAAHLILGAHLWPSSRDDIDELLELYPFAVVEFGAYDCAVGNGRHRNTIVWEVRNY